MQLKTRYLNDHTWAVLPVFPFLMLVGSTIPRLLLSSSSEHLLVRSLAVLVLSFFAVFCWRIMVQQEFLHDVASFAFLCLGITIVISLSSTVYFIGVGKEILFILALFFVIGSVLVWGRIHGLILTVFTAVSIICNQIVECLNLPSASEIMLDTAIITLLVCIALTLSLKNRSKILPTLGKTKHIQTMQLMDSTAFWREISACSIEKVSSRTLSHIRSILKTQEMQDTFLIGHSVRVMQIASRILNRIALPETEKRAIQAACLFHDIGKIEISQAILQKKSPLIKEEFDLIKTHPKTSIAILSGYGIFSNLDKIILHHHERYDGWGYPDGLAKDQIPLGARIIAVADAIDAMASARYFSHKKSSTEIIEEIKKSSGSQFDPDIVLIVLEILSE